MGDLGNVWAVVRRGLGHTGELWFITQCMQGAGYPHLNHEIETNLVAFTLIVLAATSLFELWQILVRPDLTATCIDDSPMLPFADDEK